MNAADEKRIAAKMAKTLAMMCVRNTGIETLHAGIVPVTHAGDYSDVRVIDADGREIALEYGYTDYNLEQGGSAALSRRWGSAGSSPASHLSILAPGGILRLSPRAR